MNAECDCPFCPLVRLNFQVCDAMVKITKKKDGYECSGRIPTKVMEGRSEAEKELIRDCLNHIAMWGLEDMRKNKEVAAGYEKPDCVFNLEKHGKSIRICFHAKPRVVEEPVGEDPE